jgi:hypothetical protein
MHGLQFTISAKTLPLVLVLIFVSSMFPGSRFFYCAAFCCFLLLFSLTSEPHGARQHEPFMKSLLLRSGFSRNYAHCSF